MLHVTFFKLVRSREQDLFARDVRLAIDKRHHVLQLIAKTKSAAGLIESSARPHATRERLVQQPAVEHRVQCRVGCVYFDSSEQFVPVGQHAFEGGVNVSRVTESRDYGLRRLFRLRFAEQEDHFACFVGRELDTRLDRRARIEAGAVSSGQVQPSQRRRRFE